MTTVPWASRALELRPQKSTSPACVGEMVTGVVSSGCTRVARLAPRRAFTILQLVTNSVVARVTSSRTHTSASAASASPLKPSVRTQPAASRSPELATLLVAAREATKATSPAGTPQPSSSTRSAQWTASRVTTIRLAPASRALATSSSTAPAREAVTPPVVECSRDAHASGSLTSGMAPRGGRLNLQR